MLIINEGPDRLDWEKVAKRMEDEATARCVLCGTEVMVKDALMVDGKALCFLCKTRIRVLT